MSRHSDEKQRVAALLSALATSEVPRTWTLPNGGRVTVAVPAEAGDDCAVLEIDGGVALVCGSDYVRGVGFALFERGLLGYYDIGYYLVAANISDVAAMGAQPIGVLTVVRYPQELTDEEFDSLLAGARAAAAAHDCELLGGDTGSAERVVLSASALGICQPGRVLTRSTAQPGDVLCLTGAVGAPAAALLHFTSPENDVGESRTAASERLLEVWRRPAPRVGQGRLLADRALASACQDVSDGLRATAGELAASSGVRLLLDEGAIPVDPAAREVATVAGVDPLALAMSASVDFELLFTVPALSLDECSAAFAEHGFPFHRIGEVQEGSGTALRRGDGSEVELPGVAWRHQQEDAPTALRDGLRPRPRA